MRFVFVFDGLRGVYRGSIGGKERSDLRQTGPLSPQGCVEPFGFILAANSAWDGLRPRIESANPPGGRPWPECGA